MSKSPEQVSGLPGARITTVPAVATAQKVMFQVAPLIHVGEDIYCPAIKDVIYTLRVVGVPADGSTIAAIYLGPTLTSLSLPGDLGSPNVLSSCSLYALQGVNTFKQAVNRIVPLNLVAYGSRYPHSTGDLDIRITWDYVKVPILRYFDIIFKGYNLDFSEIFLYNPSIAASLGYDRRFMGDPGFQGFPNS